MTGKINYWHSKEHDSSHDRLAQKQPLGHALSTWSNKPKNIVSLLQFTQLPINPDSKSKEDLRSQTKLLY